MTCKRVLLMSHERNRPQFTAVVFAIVSKFNIDGLYPMVYNKWQVIKKKKMLTLANNSMTCIVTYVA